MRVSFGPFSLDSGRRRLSADGGDIHLSPKAFDLLCLLLERRPNVVDKDTLLSAIWPDTTVVEANLNVLIAEIRRSLSDTPQRKAFIETVNRVGFSFCGVATDLDRPDRHGRVPEARPKFWVVWRGGTQTLSAADNVIGRHPDCQVFIEGEGVSRRHARIRVDTVKGQPTLEDLDSTNGTQLGGAPVSGCVTLADGDVIKIGSIELTFRAWADDRSRPTERIRRR